MNFKHTWLALVRPPSKVSKLSSSSSLQPLSFSISFWQKKRSVFVWLQETTFELKNYGPFNGKWNTEVLGKLWAPHSQPHCLPWHALIATHAALLNTYALSQRIVQSLRVYPQCQNFSSNSRLNQKSQRFGSRLLHEVSLSFLGVISFHREDIL